MLLNDFSERAEEFIRLAQLTRSPHDRELFVELARACYGVDETRPSEVKDPTRKH